MKLSWTLTGLMAVAVVFMGYLLMNPAPLQQSDDGRAPIYLSMHERDQVLGEMRILLEAVQAISEGIVAGDMETVAVEASAVGMVLAVGEDPATVAKLPPDFIIDGVVAHTAFDQLSQNAREFGDADMAFEELTVILSACTACHAGYRVALEGI